MQDVGLATALAVGVGAALIIRHQLVEDEPATVAGVVLSVLAALLLAFRRVHPLATLGGVAAVIALYALTDGGRGPIIVTLWVALYTMASLRDRRTVVIVAVGVAALVSLLSLLVGADLSVFELIGAAGVTLVPVLVGDAVRSRRARLVEARVRDQMAVEAREREAQQMVQEERVRIARDLHDVVAHSIATINVQAGVAAHVIDAEPDAAREALVEIKEASRSALAELRAMLRVLREADDTDASRPSPGVAQIAALVEQFGDRATLVVVGTAARPVDPAVGIAAYRIVQEALTNVMKHAAHALVEVRVEHGADHLDLSIRNDASGSPVEGEPGAGLGLVGIAERVASVGGSVASGPDFHGGFSVAATLPYEPVLALDIDQ